MLTNLNAHEFELLRESLGFRNMGPPQDIPQGNTNSIFKVSAADANDQKIDVVIKIHEPSKAGRMGVAPERVIRAIEATRYVANHLPDVKDRFGKNVGAVVLPFYIFKTGLPYTMLEFNEGAEKVTKPVSVVPFVEGEHTTASPTSREMHRFGRALAAFHTAAQGMPSDIEIDIPYGIQQWRQTMQALRAAPDAPERLDRLFSKKTAKDMLSPPSPGKQFLEKVLAEAQYVSNHWDEKTKGLPSGFLHMDYKADNILLRASDNASVVLDMDMSGKDVLALDMAYALYFVTHEKTDSRGSLEKMRAFLKGYDEVRSITAAEQKALPFMMRAIGSRFALRRTFILATSERTDVALPHSDLSFCDHWKTAEEQGLTINFNHTHSIAGQR